MTTAETETNATPDHDLILFDGECLVCRASVRWFAKRDRDGRRFRYAPLQGETLRERLSADEIAALPDSMVLLAPDGSFVVRSTAVAAALRKLGGFWWILGFKLWLIPRPIRDAGYKLIARNRKRLLKRKPSDDGATCPLPPVTLQGRMLP